MDKVKLFLKDFKQLLKKHNASLYIDVYSSLYGDPAESEIYISFGKQQKIYNLFYVDEDNDLILNGKTIDFFIKNFDKKN